METLAWNCVTAWLCSSGNGATARRNRSGVTSPSMKRAMAAARTSRTPASPCGFGSRSGTHPVTKPTTMRRQAHMEAMVAPQWRADVLSQADTTEPANTATVDTSTVYPSRVPPDTLGSLPGGTSSPIAARAAAKGRRKPRTIQHVYCTMALVATHSITSGCRTNGGSQPAAPAGDAIASAPSWRGMTRWHEAAGGFAGSLRRVRSRQYAAAEAATGHSSAAK
eukprot:scaffold24136_cov131-Isochrysis_galbana.AAC.2